MNVAVLVMQYCFSLSICKYLHQMLAFSNNLNLCWWFTLVVYKY